MVAIGPSCSVVGIRKSTEYTTKITIYPYYGGGKGQSLQITENSNGTIITEIIKTPENQKNKEQEEINPMELEYPQLPSKYEKSFSDNVKTINNNALNILSLQEILKTKGKLSEKEELLYKENMDRINEVAGELTKLQGGETDPDFEFENREGLSAWFERKNKIKAEKEANKTRENNNKTEIDKEENKSEKESENKQGKWWNKTTEEKEKENGEKVEKEKENEEGNEGENEGGNDTIEVNLPPDDASVAEANPVGLAVAGEGGVAASKPIATAVVGPGGLAIARPIATAIAGVAPDQALIPIYAEGYVGGNKPKRTGTPSPKSGEAGEYLKKLITKYHTVPDFS